MRIWFFEIGEPLPQEGNVRLHRYGNYSRYLSASGHEATIWTSTFSHAPKRHVASHDLVETFDGVTYRFLHGPGYSRNVSVARIRHNQHFARRLSEELEDIPSAMLPDILIAPIPIIEVANLVTGYGQRHGLPVVVDIRDEWPDEIVNIAPRPIRPAVRLLFRHAYRQTRDTCDRATAITGVSQRQVEYGLAFAQTAPRHFVFPHGYPDVKIRPDILEAEVSKLKREFDVTRFRANCCFFGTIGRFFDLTSILAAARNLPDVGFILAGDGPARAGFVRQAKNVNNVYFPGWLDQNQIHAVMSVCDIGLAPYTGSASFSLPNKPFEYMSGGLAILSSIQGELKHLLSEMGNGITLSVLSPSSVEAGIRHLMGPDLARMKARSQQAFQQCFAADRVYAQATRDIEALLSA